MPRMKDQYKNLQETVKDSAHKVWLASLGVASVVDEKAGVLAEESNKFLKESNKVFEGLVDRGRKLEKKTGKGLDKVKTKAKEATDRAKTEVEETVDRFETLVDERLTDVVKRLGLPKRNEIQTLSKRVEELSTMVMNLTGTKILDRKVYQVTPQDDAWMVTLDGKKKPLAQYETKSAALEAARELAKANEPSQLIIHRADGTVQTSHTYDPDAAS